MMHIRSDCFRMGGEVDMMHIRSDCFRMEVRGGRDDAHQVGLACFSMVGSHVIKHMTQWFTGGDKIKCSRWETKK